MDEQTRSSGAAYSQRGSKDSQLSEDTHWYSFYHDGRDPVLPDEMKLDPPFTAAWSLVMAEAIERWLGGGLI